jgi:hypothetical protein
MLSFPHMLYFLVHEFTGLRGWRFAFSFVLTSAFNCLLLWHDSSLKKWASGIDPVFATAHSVPLCVLM